MNKDKFTELFTAGDPDGLWALIENETTGATDAEARIAKLTFDQEALIADKDAAHEATIARMKEDVDAAQEKAAHDYAAALDASVTRGDAALAQAAVDYAKAAEATKLIADDAIGALRDALDQAMQEKNDLSELSNSLIAKANAERDAAKAELAATEARQDKLAADSIALAASLKTVAAQVEAFSIEAGKKLADKQAEANAQRLADAEALVAKLRAGA